MKKETIKRKILKKIILERVTTKVNFKSKRKVSRHLSLNPYIPKENQNGTKPDSD